MRKKIILVLGALLVLLIVAAVIALMNANALVQRYKPKLEAQASKVLGTPVTFESVETQVVPATRIVVKKLGLGNSEARENFSLGSLSMTTRLLPLLRKRLEIVKIELNAPAITLIKDQGGVRLAGLSRRETPRPAEPAASAPVTSPAADTAGNGREAGLVLDLESFELNNGRVRFDDRVAGKTYEVTGLEMDAGVRLAGGRVEIAKADCRFSVEGHKAKITTRDIGYDLQNKKLDLKEAEITTSGSELRLSAALDQQAGTTVAEILSGRLDIAGLLQLAAEFVPTLAGQKLAGTIAPKLKVEKSSSGLPGVNGMLALSEVDAAAGSINVQKLSTTIALEKKGNSQEAHVRELTLGVNGMPVSGEIRATYQDNSLHIPQLALAGFGGRLDGRASFQLDSKAFSSSTQVGGMVIQQLLQALKPGAPPPVTGVVRSLTAKVQGAARGRVADTLHGDVAAAVVDGELPQVNLAREVLGKVTGLPFMHGALLENVPPEFREALAGDSTKIKSLDVRAQLNGRTVNVRSLELISSFFDLRADGNYNMDSGLAMRGEIVFSPSFSAALAGRVKELSYALDDQKRLIIPLQLRGVPPSITVLPNIERLLKLGVENKVKGEAKRLLGDALDKGVGRGLGGLLGLE